MIDRNQQTPTNPAESNDEQQGGEGGTACHEDHGGHDGHQHHREHHLVIITVNNHEHRIGPGVHSVTQIKTVGHVPLPDDLEQITHGGQLHLLPDDGNVTIKGGECFVSHPKSGASS